MRRASLIFLLALVALLLSGTLKIGLLTDAYAQVTLPLSGAQNFQEFLSRLVPYDADRGEEGVTVQGVVLIGLLVLISVAAWKGLENILDGFSGWTWAALGLTALTLLMATLGITVTSAGLQIALTGKFIGVLLALAALTVLFKTHLSEAAARDWLWESWRFVKQIFPLLIAGVFAVGVIRQLIRPEWIESLAGQNTVPGNVAGVIFGVFMYFPTLVEVPIANMFLGLGMHRGPLLAYLMADPELSLQSILIVSAIIGRIRAWTYVGWVALFSTLAGLTYGAWVDGLPLGWIALAVLAFLSALTLTLWQIGRRNAVAELAQVSTRID
jgi:hypothetical protein